MFNFFRNFFRRTPPTLAPAIAQVIAQAKARVRYPDIPMMPGMSDPGLASLAVPDRNGNMALRKYAYPEIPKGVVPIGVTAGMDAAGNPFPNTEIMGQMDGATALGFLGFTYLAQLAQVPEYNLINTVFADELIGSWITVEPSTDGELADTKQAIVELKEEIERFQVKFNMYYMVYMDGTFGKGSLYPHIESDSFPLEELRQLPLALDPNSVKIGSLKYFKTVEPYWVAPQEVNTYDPLRLDHFKPKMWYVSQSKLHESRLKSLVMNPVPDLLKPYYWYGGLSRTQLCMPGTNRAIRTLNNITALIEKFSIIAFKTDLQGLLENSEAMDRINWFNKVRNNLNMLLIDSSNSEELIMLNAQLGGLKDLAEQAVKFMAMYARIPNTKLLQDEVGKGQLEGSKASPQMDEWEQFVQIQRKTHLTPILEWQIYLIMLNKWGKIRKDISVKWNSVHELGAEGKAALGLIKAQIAQIHVGLGSIDDNEVRERLSKDEDSEYSGLKGKAPGPPKEPQSASTDGRATKSPRP